VRTVFHHGASIPQTRDPLRRVGFGVVDFSDDLPPDFRRHPREPASAPRLHRAPGEILTCATGRSNHAARYPGKGLDPLDLENVALYGIDVEVAFGGERGDPLAPSLADAVKRLKSVSSPVTNHSKVDSADQIRAERLGGAHCGHRLLQSTDVRSQRHDSAQHHGNRSDRGDLIGPE
jgi:hypothetical protein